MSDTDKRVQEWLENNKAPKGAEVGFVWVDIETTGLRPAFDHILEVAFMITDAEGNWINYAEVLTYGGMHAASRLRGGADVFVREMHDKSGLWDAIAAADPEEIYIQTADESLDEFLADNLGSIKVPLAGSSVHFDRKFLEGVFPDLMGTYFTYRNIDISTLTELAKVLNPEARDAIEAELTPMKHHRGLPDLIDTIELFRAYKKDFLWTTADSEYLGRVVGVLNPTAVNAASIEVAPPSESGTLGVLDSAIKFNSASIEVVPSSVGD